MAIYAGQSRNLSRGRITSITDSMTPALSVLFLIPLVIPALGRLDHLPQPQRRPPRHLVGQRQQLQLHQQQRILILVVHV